MNRVEFIKQLKELLSDVPNSEREEAVTYYNDYFNDAGVENEQEVIDALGSPERVAATIKAGLGGRVIDGEFTETGYRDAFCDAKEEIAKKGKAAGNWRESGNEREAGNGQSAGNGRKMEREKEAQKDYTRRRPNENRMLRLILYVLLAVLLSPLWMPVGGGLAGVLAAAAAIALVCILLVFLVPVIVLIAGVSVFAAGIAAFFVGLVRLFITPAAAIGLLGIAMLLLGIGLLASVFGGWILIKLMPPMLRGFVDLCRKPFTKKGEKV